MNVVVGIIDAPYLWSYWQDASDTPNLLGFRERTSEEHGLTLGDVYYLDDGYRAHWYQRLVLQRESGGPGFTVMVDGALGSRPRPPSAVTPKLKRLLETSVRCHVLFVASASPALVPMVEALRSRGARLYAAVYPHDRGSDLARSASRIVGLHTLLVRYREQPRHDARTRWWARRP